MTIEWLNGREATVAASIIIVVFNCLLTADERASTSLKTEEHFLISPGQIPDGWLTVWSVCVRVCARVLVLQATPQKMTSWQRPCL